MFGISFSEISVVLLITFLIVGPKKMTQLAYQIGAWISKIKQELKIIKETQIDPLKDSVFYDPNIKMNVNLNEIIDKIEEPKEEPKEEPDTKKPQQS